MFSPSLPRESAYAQATSTDRMENREKLNMSKQYQRTVWGTGTKARMDTMCACFRKESCSIWNQILYWEWEEDVFPQNFSKFLKTLTAPYKCNLRTNPPFLFLFFYFSLSRPHLCGGQCGVWCRWRGRVHRIATLLVTFALQGSDPCTRCIAREIEIERDKIAG